MYLNLIFLIFKIHLIQTLKKSFLENIAIENIVEQ